MTTPLTDLLARIQGGLIVSCQAQPNDALYGAAFMAAMAASAVRGGACGIRANGAADIRAIKAVTDVPVIGIFKHDYPDSKVRITPLLEDALPIIEAGAEIIAIDATPLPRPNGVPLAEVVASIREVYDGALMADISTLEEGVEAARLGFDLIGTTLSGYTPYSRKQEGPDLALIGELASAIDRPIIAEGRITTPDDARAALEQGAHAVVVGTMITRPQVITAYFVKGMSSQ